jgi:ribosomal protein S18 acetylase RimI-like enzyme
MIIRRLLPSDAALFHRLRLESLQDSPSAFGSSLEEEASLALSSVEGRLSISFDRGVYGAFDKTKLVGLIGLGRENLKNLSHKVFVWGMYVTPTYRGASIGKALLATALSLARSIPNVRQVNLSVNATNDSAIRLYESFGFSSFGREPEAMLINGVLYDEIHMRLSLTTG